MPIMLRQATNLPRRFRWPFALRSTVDDYRILLIGERARNAELSTLLTNTMNELQRHKIALGQRSAAFKTAVEVSTLVKDH